MIKSNGTEALQILRALGVENLQQCCKVVVTFETNKPVQLEVTRYLPSAKTPIIQTLGLVAQPLP